MKTNRNKDTAGKESFNAVSGLGRRSFLKRAGTFAGAIAVAPMVVPSTVFGANERIALGFIGVGNQGTHLANNLRNSCDIVAVSDVYLPRARRFAGNFRANHVHRDYRELLEHKDIDAVVVATPLHWHALNCIHAAQAGKDIFCEKPLTHSIVEGRRVVEAVRKYDRVLQTGVQGRLNRNAHSAITHLRNNTLGKITKLYAHNYHSPMEPRHPEEPVRDGLDWDMWLGPAEEQPFNFVIWDNRSVPSWVSLRPFSGSSMTDWGSHGLDLAQWGLGMDASGPEEVWVEGEPFKPMHSTPENPGRRQQGPNSPKVLMKYPGNIIMEFEGVQRWQEVRFVCEEGTISVTRDGFGGDDRIRRPLENPEIEIYRGDAYARSHDHLQDWLNCIKDRTKPCADVEIGHRTATICHLANIARWVSGVTGQTGGKLKWDAVNERFTNSDAANRFILSSYRNGYELPSRV